MKALSIAKVGAVIGIGVFAAQPSARADFSMTLTNCNSSFGCATPTGNNIATVSVTDLAANQVQITVTPTSPFVLVGTGLDSFSFSLASGIGAATISLVSGPGFSVVAASNADGMGTFAYALDRSPNGAPGTVGPLVFNVSASGLNAVLTDFATGGAAFNAPNGYYFVADVGCVATTGAAGAFCDAFLSGTGNTGLAGGLGNPVPGPVIGAGLPGLLAACAGLVMFARRRQQKFA